MKKIFLLLLITTILVAAVDVGATPDIGAASSQINTASQGVTPTLSEATLTPVQPPAPAAAEPKPIKSGKVLEVIDSPMYTYLKVTSGKGTVWLAAYKTDITRGSTVRYSGGVEMPKFYSKSLNRTFDLIVFVDSLELVME